MYTGESHLHASTKITLSQNQSMREKALQGRNFFPYVLAVDDNFKEPQQSLPFFPNENKGSLSLNKHHGMISLKHGDYQSIGNDI